MIYNVAVFPLKSLFTVYLILSKVHFTGLLKNSTKYIKYILNRKDNMKLEFEVFQSDIIEDPKEIILNLKDEILKLL